MTEKAAQIILGGGVVIYPTETVYGLGASALDEKAIFRVFQIKRRPLSMPITLAISSLKMLEEVAEIQKQDLGLLKKLLPGPVTVLVRKKPKIPDILTGGSPLVGIRFPDHEIALKIIDAAGPITSTSANISGQPAPASIDQILSEILESVDLTVDGGRSKYAESSTLLDLASRKVVRKGAGLEVVLEAIG